MDAKQIAREIAQTWDALDNLQKALLTNEITEALVAYGNARLEQAAEQIERERPTEPRTQVDLKINGALRHAQEIVRAMKEQA